MKELKHIPVMLKECTDALEVKPGGLYFDGTLGGAGHSYEILRLSAPDGKLAATDLDGYAIDKAEEKLKEYAGRYEIFKDNFKNFRSICEKSGYAAFDGVLLDLGVSSFQLDDRERGFSYMADGERLDMRMDKSSSPDAAEVINTYSENALKRIFYEYGEERFSPLIAKNIVAAREKEKIETCGRLSEIIRNSIPKKFQTDGHPSKRVFQALRIEVNGELDGLKEALTDMVRGLRSGGRIAVITFHSLEDRIVKQTFRELESDCVCDKSLPVCVCGKKREIKIITKRPVLASDEETTYNPRSKSAKLRVAEKI